MEKLLFLGVPILKHIRVYKVHNMIVYNYFMPFTGKSQIYRCGRPGALSHEAAYFGHIVVPFKDNYGNNFRCPNF